MHHNAYVNYFKSLAISHYLIQHTVGGRNTFFRMNGEAEMQQALAASGADFPCLVLPMYYGALRSNGLSITDVMNGEFEIRTHVEVLDFDAEETARALCKQIGMDIITNMALYVEENGDCGVIGGFDIESVKYDFTGPININEYGCRFRFELTDTAINLATADNTGIFI